MKCFILDFLRYVFIVLPAVFALLGIFANVICVLSRLVKSHTGEYLAEELRTCLERYGISKKMLSLVADNASNNNTLVVELESLGGINSAATRVRCAAHILNLVVKVSNTGRLLHST